MCIFLFGSLLVMTECSQLAVNKTVTAKSVLGVVSCMMELGNRSSKEEAHRTWAMYRLNLHCLTLNTAVSSDSYADTISTKYTEITSA